MERKSKTQKEIYMESYAIEKLAKNPLLIVESIGYLKCLSQFLPAEDWIEEEMEKIGSFTFNFYFIRG